MQKSELRWRGLLDCQEAKVLSPVEERRLLVELVECKQRILKALAPPGDASWDEAEATTGFQQLIRDLAASEETRVDPPFPTVGSMACRYQEIRAKLAMANLRLVAHVAKRYRDRGIPAGDLMQEGFCALLVAIDRFDLVNETRLATYAIWWIRQAIQHAVASGAYPVRLNPRQLHQLAQAQAMSEGWKRDRTARSDSPLPTFSPTIEYLFAATRPALSLNAPSRCDDSATIGDFLAPADQQDSAATEAEATVGDLIKVLNDREQLVIKFRFGLDGESLRTFVQISRILGISKERVRQIQDRALTKLRRSAAGDSHMDRNPPTSAYAPPFISRRSG
jgi:RNA polymerase primary sigma factor